MPNLVSYNIQNESILPRIVGFEEYHNALKMFDRLAAISTAEEMKVYDRMIAQRPEFAIFVGRPATATADGNRIVFAQTFRQSGLNWMTALARVELGSMIGAFSDQENPFQQVASTNFDVAEFNTLLREGWQLHRLGIKQLAQNPVLSRQRVPGSDRGAAIIKTARRSKLASDMVTVAAATMNPVSSEGQFAQLQQDYDQLQDYRDYLAKELKYEIQRTQTSSGRPTGWQTQTIPGCARGGVEAALASGRYTIKKLK